jgi:hypothetical protein
MKEWKIPENENILKSKSHFVAFSNGGFYANSRVPFYLDL